MHISLVRPLISFAVCAALLAAASHAPAQRPPSAPSPAPAAALEAGRASLRRNRADEALPKLESALSLFTQAGDALGAAAARDAIGDVYQRQGQHSTALQNYESAFKTFCERRDGPNADLMLVKIGETHYLAGDAERSREAFARMGRCGSGEGSGAGTNGDSRDGGGGFAFLSAGDAAAGLASCSVAPPLDGPASNSAQQLATGPMENGGPTLGRPPTPQSRSVRMDLRVVDQSGNPVTNAKAKLWSERQPNGFLCECEHFTDVQGKVLMDPIHYTKTLTLELEAKGYEPLKTPVDPYSLNKPFRAVLQAKGAAQSAARQAAGAAQSASAPACAGLFRLFVARGFGVIGAARTDFEAGRLGEARARYEGLLAASKETSPAGNLQAARLFRAVARTSLGDIALKEGRFAEAERLYREAVAGAIKDNRLELAWAAQMGLARSLWAQGAGVSADAAQKRERALAAYREAVATVETIYAGSLRADEARSNFLASTRDLFDEAAGAFAESALASAPAAAPRATRVSAHAQTAPAPLAGRALAHAAEAFRVAEQGRARSLLDLLNDSRAEITADLPPELAARRLANRARQQEIAEALRGVSVAGATPAQRQSVAQLEQELERLGGEHDRMESELRTASARNRAHFAPLSLAEVQQKVLDEGTALLAYSLGRERSYLFAVTRAGVTLHRLPARAAVEAQVAALRDQLIPPNFRRAIAADSRGIGVGRAPAVPQVVATYADAALAFYREYVAPAAPSFGARRLLVVADGALNYVPFEALVVAPGGEDFSTLNYLVKTNEVVYAPSASVVAAVRAQRRESAGGVLVIADPVFDVSDERARDRGMSDAGARRGVVQSALADVTGLKPATPLKLVRLDGTRTEAQGIAALARAGGPGADVWLGFDASEANVWRRGLAGYRVIHFATHGLLDSERPQFTGLALTLVGDTETDGFLRVGEVFNLRLGSPLVMLSACETGLGREKRGEGVIGLTRAFMYAGAPAVGVSLWNVNDRSTAELMPEFYRRLIASGGREPAAAMRAAQQQMIAGKRHSAPYYWAPFVLVGDWR